MTMMKDYFTIAESQDNRFNKIWTLTRFLAQNGMGQSDAMRLAQRSAEDGNEIANGRRATSYYGNGGNSSMINQRNSRDFY